MIPAQPVKDAGQSIHADPDKISRCLNAQQTVGIYTLPLLTGWLDQLNATERWALLKLITGTLRVGVSARLAKTAVASVGNVPVEVVEEIWHGLAPPYLELFAWLDGKAERPDALAALAFRPLMLAHPLAEGELANFNAPDYSAEWKWDGIRVQLQDVRYKGGPGVLGDKDPV